MGESLAGAGSGGWTRSRLGSPRLGASETARDGAPHEHPAHEVNRTGPRAPAAGFHVPTSWTIVYVQPGSWCGPTKGEGPWRSVAVMPRRLVSTTLPGVAAARARRSHTPFGWRPLVSVVGPSIRDPRIHLSITILTIITIGTGWLGFRLSVPRSSSLRRARRPKRPTYRRTARSWPASAFQTATSTALLFRVIGTENGAHWTFHGWHLFVGVGPAGLVTKYLVRVRGGHIFNPSNIALVGAFILLGSQRVEPLDFWWAPIGPAMIAAYAVIFAGGLFICGRLRLLGMGLALWLSLAAGMAVLAALGHTITTRWSFTPIGGAHFWWIVLTSPEIFIFLFFMITDPRTVPAGRVARVVFGVAVGVTSSLLMAPWDTEFGVKVGLSRGSWWCVPSAPSSSTGSRRRRRPTTDLGLWLGRALVAGSGPPRRRRRLVVARVVTGDPRGRAVGGGDHRRRFAGPVDRGRGARCGRRGDIADVDPRRCRPCRSTRRSPARAPDWRIRPEPRLAATLAWNLQVEAEALSTGDACRCRRSPSAPGYSTSKPSSRPVRPTAGV